MESHTFSVDVKSLICPVSLAHENPELRELVELHLQSDSLGIPLFPARMPAWVLDFKQIVGSADMHIESAREEMLARL